MTEPTSDPEFVPGEKVWTFSKYPWFPDDVKVGDEVSHLFMKGKRFRVVQVHDKTIDARLL
jgi:hypothetical protein